VTAEKAGERLDVRRRRTVCVVAVLAALAAGTAAAAKDPCKDWKKEVQAARGYVAKLTFHRIDVTFDGEVLHNERDEDEIREGEQVWFDEIECEDGTVDLVVRSVERKVKTKLRLLLSEAEREARGAAAIQELFEVVVAPPER
jgi:hypothetical protein